MQLTIAKIALATPVRTCFDYVVPLAIAPLLKAGMRVWVPFRRKNTVGVVVEPIVVSTVARHKLKSITAVIDAEPLFDAATLAWLLWIADYYQYPVGEVVLAALPTLLRQGEQAKLSQCRYYQLTAAGAAVDFATLSRAAKQKQALSLLAEDGALTTPALQQHDISLDVLRRLQAKGWVTVAERPLESASTSISTTKAPSLTAEQQQAVSAITIDGYGCYLLDGVTGSGKTEVYLSIIKTVLLQGKQVLVLVPEINLTPQTLARFQARFTEAVLAFHSSLTDKERCQAWLRAQLGQANIIIGTRSAVMMPFRALGLIIVDEEHDLSFKQQEGLRYSARDIAIKRASDCAIPIVLGSATPSLESMSNVERNRYHWLSLTERAGDAKLPAIQLLDIRHLKLTEGLSAPLVAKITQHLQRGNQVLIFVNRKGYAPTLYCHQCGWVAECTRCDTRFTLYKADNKLQCHRCLATKPIPTACEQCHEPSLLPLGVGTQRLAQFVEQQFPDYICVRIDSDAIRKKGELNKLLAQIKQRHAHIIIGTQMLAKGHHFPGISLVAVINIDDGLLSSDFRAAERMAQLLMQVAGRAGRGAEAGEVVVQTHHPQHPLLTTLVNRGYQAFVSQALAERRATGLPPYAYLALLRGQAHDKSTVEAFMKVAKQYITAKKSAVVCYGPLLAPIQKVAGQFRMQLFMQAEQRALLHGLLSELMATLEARPAAGKLRWSLDIDPLDIC